MKVAIFQTGQAPTSLCGIYGDYDAMSKNLIGYAPDEADTFVVREGDFPPISHDYDLFIVTGSRCGVYEDHFWIPQLESVIRNAYHGTTQLIGLCFGHQILAQALGGKVVNSDKGYGIGVMDYNLSTKFNTQHKISLCAWHQDQVVIPPDDADVFLTSPFCKYAGLVYGTQAISFQPHPEFSKAFLKDLIALRNGDTITADMARDANATLVKATDTPVIQKLLSKFLARETLKFPHDLMLDHDAA